ESKKTQEEIASQIETTQANYGKIENGNIEPGIEKLIKLANLYNVSIDYLVGRQFENDLGYLTKEEREFIKIYLKLNQQNKINIAGYALGLYSQQEED
ncbi:MAG: helix-turn-helix transcriptional regulator, partial [Clostridia bacterium]|nr:helix-turn-helix transcriptional regulator [Clostridia bacterium]